MMGISIMQALYKCVFLQYRRQLTEEFQMVCVNTPAPRGWSLISPSLSWVWAGFSILLLMVSLQKDKDRNWAMGEPGNHHLNLVRNVRIISNVLWVSGTP